MLIASRTLALLLTRLRGSRRLSVGRGLKLNAF